MSNHRAKPVDEWIERIVDAMHCERTGNANESMQKVTTMVTVAMCDVISMLTR